MSPNATKPAVNPTIVLAKIQAKDNRAILSRISREKFAAMIIAFASLVWITGLFALGQGQSSLPWSCTLIATTIGALLSTRKGNFTYATKASLIAERQPISFLEALALTYISISLILASWIVYHLLYRPPALTIKRQVVDIELTSLYDFQDRHDLMPGTKEKLTLKKVTGDKITQRGALQAKQSAQASKATSSAVGTPHRAIVAKDQSAFLLKPQPLEPHPFPAKIQGSTQDSQFWQEVQPPELVELLDSEGKNSMDVWQAGGQSSGGSGAKSELTTYLKELNKRIKSAWMPPRGETRTTEILFRIAKSGRLESYRLANSSGNPNVDQSAIEALLSAAPLPPLPASYPHNHLDLHYSFNYNVDELTETNSN